MTAARCMPVGILLCAVAAGCDEAARRNGVPAATPSGAASAVVLASSEPLPETFGFGRAAEPGQIARLAIAVMPDGRGLPAGRGTSTHGSSVYAAQCASCHGRDGEGVTGAGQRLVRTPDDTIFDFGTSVEREVQKNVGNYWPYATTLFDYIRRSMPFERPGSLTDDEVYAVTAYLLHRNGIIAEDAVMDSTTLPAVVMPARDRFRRDDREGSTRVR